MSNIKHFIRQALSDKDITDLTADKKVYFLHATNANAPYVEYQIYDEHGELWAENVEIKTTYYIQVDIFSRGDYSELENRVKQKMINAGLARTSGADLYEEDTELYHKAMRFVITL